MMTSPSQAVSLLYVQHFEYVYYEVQLFCSEGQHGLGGYGGLPQHNLHGPMLCFAAATSLTRHMWL